MIVEIRVRTRHKGMVAIPSIQFDRIWQAGNDLVLTHNGSSNFIPNNEMKNRIVKVGKEIFYDKFSGASYRLLYFKKPRTMQLELWKRS